MVLKEAGVKLMMLLNRSTNSSMSQMGYSKCSAQEWKKTTKVEEGQEEQRFSSLTKSSQVNYWFMQQPSLELNQNVISCTIEHQKKPSKKYLRLVNK